MKKQITFEKEDYCIDWISNLSKCFEIKSCKIKRVKRKHWAGDYFVWRMIIDYE